ncbi:glutamine synthetase [bacterium]|jgi:glutamine synthetase|nr:glutamine synthetase [bacterium]
MASVSFAEYIWLDGAKPSAKLRSKTRVLRLEEGQVPGLNMFPEWGYDGSSTNQAEGNFSDLLLRPVNFVDDPIRGDGNFLVLCEVYTPEGVAHSTNTRAILRNVLDAGGAKHEPTVGFEQEYTLFSGNKPLAWPDNGEPNPQGPYYCGVGPKQIYGRELVEDHAELCAEAGLMLYGTNAEVMPGQWEFQIGYRGFEEDENDALNICDHHWIATWLLHRLSEEYELHVSYDNKPMRGDWNGAGCHTNLSTKEMRDPKIGKKTIDEAVEALSKKHDEHIAVYGADLDKRLTGDHETCSITEFRSGVSDRGSSIRIPMSVSQKGYGYIEDRRPGANSDPYVVTARLLDTILDLDEPSIESFTQAHLKKTSKK